MWVFVGIVCFGGVAALTGFSKDKRGKYEVSILGCYTGAPFYVSLVWGERATSGRCTTLRFAQRRADAVPLEAVQGGALRGKCC